MWGLWGQGGQSSQVVELEGEAFRSIDQLFAPSQTVRRDLSVCERLSSHVHWAPAFSPTNSDAHRWT